MPNSSEIAFLFEHMNCEMDYEEINLNKKVRALIEKEIIPFFSYKNWIKPLSLLLNKAFQKNCSENKLRQ